MKSYKIMAILLTLILAFAGIQARVLPGYADVQSLTKAKNGGTEGTSFPDAVVTVERYLISSSSGTEIVWKWFINIANWAARIAGRDKVAITTDLGRTPRPAPPSPRPPPGSRPVVAY